MKNVSRLSTVSVNFSGISYKLSQTVKARATLVINLNLKTIHNLFLETYICLFKLFRRENVNNKNIFSA